MNLQFKNKILCQEIYFGVQNQILESFYYKYICIEQCKTKIRDKQCKKIFLKMSAGINAKVDSPVKIKYRPSCTSFIFCSKTFLSQFIM